MKRLALILLAILATLTACSHKPYDIIDKFEANGKCYVVVPIEVTPEEYIGLDKGDVYKAK